MELRTNMQYHNLEHTEYYRQSRQFIKQFGEVSNVPDILKEWMKELPVIHPNNLSEEIIVIPNGLNEWISEQRDIFVSPDVDKTFYRMLQAMVTWVCRSRDFNVYDFPIKSRWNEGFEPLWVRLIEDGIINQVVKDFDPSIWEQYKDNKNIPFIFRYLHQFRNLPPNSEFTLRTIDPLGYSVAHYAVIYDCLPKRVGETVLELKNNDGVSVRELKTIMFATGLRDRRFAVEYE